MRPLKSVLEAPVGLSLLHGPREPTLLEQSLGQLLDEQANKYPKRDAIVSCWSGARLTYEQLNARSKIIAASLIALSIQPGERIAIFSGNCERYVELFFGATSIGAIVVVLNTTYTPVECANALEHSDCHLIFASPQIGRRSVLAHLEYVKQASKGSESSILRSLKDVILMREAEPWNGDFMSYDDFITFGNSVPSEIVEGRRSQVHFLDTCNIQFTSGTTANPKAVMLSHYNIVNNARFIGDQMRLIEIDRICCPPPLFHCFGLVLGLSACITHGSALILPSSTFDPVMVLKALVDEKCTGLHGVPTMFVAVLEQFRLKKGERVKLRTGIAAGSSVPRALMEELRVEFGITDLTITYGMTETSPASFMTSVDDAVEDKVSTVGRILPHTSAKVIDHNGSIVPRGVPGELCVSGYCLQKGYLNDTARTAEVMIEDQDGVMWMHTGDEVTLNERGFCRITGRIKDIIIRGGENIYPGEIEERLGQHSHVVQAAVVGVKNSKYGEAVAAFLQPEKQHAQLPTARPMDEELQAWVGATLGRHKVPAHFFWLGDEGVFDSFPVTGSGKVKKNELRHLGNAMRGSVDA